MRAHNADAAENDSEHDTPADSPGAPSPGASAAGRAQPGPAADAPDADATAGGDAPRAPDGDPEELATPGYRLFRDRAREATWWSMARRRPALVGRALAGGRGPATWPPPPCSGWVWARPPPGRWWRPTPSWRTCSRPCPPRPDRGGVYRELWHLQAQAYRERAGEPDLAG
ncbi:hypothetical protein [Nocardiopsis sp. CC223A]|uniref:hypothetical protein n=1 Tax=Nocardiopsis sp. CC223A TaxID=3044051 RepID=UPI0027954468|nr:hypothetical protein [Nocardiopsis sp. CC223A]